MHGNENRVYNEAGVLTFEGAMAHGKKHGKGITYYDNGNMKFNGYLIMILWMDTV